MNYKQRFAMLNKYKQKWLELNPELTNNSGIYILEREENGFKYCYIGQAVRVLERLCSHMLGYQHIDISLKKRGFYSKNNLQGWKVSFIEVPQKDLDYQEQCFIKYYAMQGYQLRYNKTGGGQYDKKGFEQEQTNGYYKGLKKGRENQLKEIKVYFDKYIDFVIKGKPNKIKERKLKEFEELLKGEIENDTKRNGV